MLRLLKPYVSLAWLILVYGDGGNVYWCIDDWIKIQTEGKVINNCATQKFQLRGMPVVRFFYFSTLLDSLWYWSRGRYQTKNINT